MGKHEVIDINNLKLFEIAGKNTRLQKGDDVIYHGQNGKPPSFSFVRKDLAITINGYTTITNSELVDVDKFEQWFGDFSKLFLLNVELELKEIDKEDFYFKLK